MGCYRKISRREALEPQCLLTPPPVLDIKRPRVVCGQYQALSHVTLVSLDVIPAVMRCTKIFSSAQSYHLQPGGTRDFV